MSKNYEDYKPINPQPPRRRKNVGLTFIKYAILVVLVMALALSALFFITSHTSEKGGTTDNAPTLNTDNSFNTTDTPEDMTEVPESEETNEPDVPEEPEVVYTNVEVQKSSMNKGGLILVSSNYKVVFPAEDELVNISTVKSKSYKLSANTMKAHKDIIDAMNKMIDDFAEATGKTDLIVWTSYRDEARQKQVYDEYVAKNGEEAAKKAV
ncbi:MAG: hypothetical protein IKU45_05980, partial [Clostridia bacterium]|nr:hypothetical protein [Clostridia bacterium]